MDKEKYPLDYVLAVMFSLGFLVLIFTILFVKVQPESKDLLTVLAQALIGIVTTIVGFRYGSSKGSRDKDETIQSVVKSEPSGEK